MCGHTVPEFLISGFLIIENCVFSTCGDFERQIDLAIILRNFMAEPKMPFSTPRIDKKHSRSARCMGTGLGNGLRFGPTGIQRLSG